MVRKKVDSRIRVLIENGLTCHHRSLLLIVGDHGRDQVVNLHYILTKSSVKTKPSVLWAYKKDLGFTSHRHKRMRKMKKEVARGLRDEDEKNPLDLFLSSTDIRYVYYKETDKILGNTYGMLVLQDFASLTPNLLARTIETVEGGGLIIMLIKSLSSLKQLYTMTMDVHSRFRTESQGQVTGRFNERFLLSLALCRSCLVLDDELNILPISSHIRQIQKVIQPTIPATPNNHNTATDAVSTRTFSSPSAAQLYELQQSLLDTQPIGSLVSACRTLDQARAVLTFVESISEKTLRATVVLTAARGRGKSAALGLSVAAAIAYGYSNIFVTAPSPENLKTFFQMLLSGFDALSYAEHRDYDIIQSANPEFNKAVVRVNVFHSHRQTIQYIHPTDCKQLSQAELLVIDEAAAIPLPLVKALLGPYLVFMSSTINGYEGTGRALSLKLVKQLRQQSVAAAINTQSSAGESASQSSADAIGGRALREISLDEPIRYAPSDPVESWLNDLLCLNCTSTVQRLSAGMPHPSQCALYYVERDTLFSAHRASESFLQRMMSLYVSSHYKNSPNDLQLMSDAPAHQLFVLLGPQSHSSGESTLPDILAVLQVCLEGAISKSSVLSGLGRGDRAAGDLIPWCVAQQYQNAEFAQLSGARIVRIATHPELQRMGYGARALQLLIDYYQGKFSTPQSQTQRRPQDRQDNGNHNSHAGEAAEANTLLTETLLPRSSLPPLLQSLADVPPPVLHYIGVSYGLTDALFGFWVKAGFLPLYLRLTPNALTGEHTCIMLRLLQTAGREDVASVTDGTMQMREDWLTGFVADFRRRFTSLLGYQFSTFDCGLALSILREQGQEAQTNTQEQQTADHLHDEKENCSTDGSPQPTGLLPLSFPVLSAMMTEYDLQRLESYADNLVDYHLVLDLIPLVARLFFQGSITNLHLSYTQQAILLALGLQHKTAEHVSGELSLPNQQVLAQFNKSVRKISMWMRDIHTRGKHKNAQNNKQTEKRKETKTDCHSEQAADEADGAAAGTRDADGYDDDTAAAVASGVSLGPPVPRSLDNDLSSAASKVKAQLKAKQKALLSTSSLQQYAIAGADDQWDAELKGGALNRVTIKTDRVFEGKRRVVHEKKKRTGETDVGSSSKASGKKRKIKQ